MNDGASPARMNAAIARAYDALVYDMGAATALDPPYVFGVGALHGCARDVSKKFDVLDLGCGTGAQLERLASQTRGLIVGVDIAPGACEAARKRLAAAGGRAQVLCRDILDIEPGNLGSFDLILHLGVDRKSTRLNSSH